MRLLTTPETQRRLGTALDHMSEALGILDEMDAPAEIGSILDLAINRLESAIGRDGEDRPTVQKLIDELERELAVASITIEPGSSPWEVQPS